jgi:predicted protein tyrosine phosphatase
MGGSPSRVLGETLIQGGEDVLDSREFFKTNNIVAVCGVCHRSVDVKKTKLKQKQVMWINKNDMPGVQLRPHFEDTTKFIHTARAGGGNVYVHCSAGISRSTTISIAYLTTWLDLDVDSALRVMRAARPAVSPNYSFLEQLHAWQSSDERVALRAELADSFHGGTAIEQTDLYKHDMQHALSHVATVMNAKPLLTIADRREIAIPTIQGQLARQSDSDSDSE